jgi:repressor LexA
MCSVKRLTDRQGEILDFIRRHRHRAGFAPSVRDIGAEFGLAPATVHEHIRALERKGHLERTPRQSRTLSPVARGVPKSPPAPSTAVPILGRVAAGSPILAAENIEDTLDLPPEWAAPDSFLLRVEGDSMRDAHILNGDLVLVRPQATASDNEIVVALVEDEATVQRFRKRRGRIELHPANPDIQPIRISATAGLDVRILGRVVGVFRPPVRSRTVSGKP